MPKKLLLLIICCYAIFCNAQIPDLHKFLGNVVEFEKGDFGFIIGRTNDEIYFISASETSLVPVISQVHFYKSPVVSQGQFIKTFQIDKLFVHLYAAKSNPSIQWQSYSYGSLMDGQTFYSYLDNAKTDSIWYVNSSPITINDRISPGILQLKISRDDNFYHGMPLVDPDNQIVGVIAEETVEGATLFQAIDMKAIQKKIFAFSGCKYFKMVAYGQSATPCETQKKIEQEEVAAAKTTERNNKMYPLAFGPSITPLFTFSGGPNAGITAVGATAGANIYINPDKGRIRFTLKPSVSYVPFHVRSGNVVSSSFGYTVSKMRFFEIGMPIMFEYITKRDNSSGESFLGIGYVPMYQTALHYRYSTTNHKDRQTGIIPTTAGYRSKVAVNVGITGSNVLIALVAAYQLDSWNDASYNDIIENYYLSPTKNYGDGYFQLGLEIAFRLKGEWGLKSKK